ncbi:MAG: hypothetical protein MT490_04805 [Sphingomonas sp.]|uniref:hypothetical protein n=1 Tax=Sphingomonas sp. TaxID=28214 RepID=UPI002274BB0F|nr:hypothetical protein [Sphingomonas sp.]MCX8475100.1 hypothetical protein [Sphingomonas sp.]
MMNLLRLGQLFVGLTSAFAAPESIAQVAQTKTFACYLTELKIGPVSQMLQSDQYLVGLEFANGATGAKLVSFDPHGVLGNLPVENAAITRDGSALAFLGTDASGLLISIKPTPESAHQYKASIFTRKDTTVAAGLREWVGSCSTNIAPTAPTLLGSIAQMSQVLKGTSGQ